LLYGRDDIPDYRIYEVGGIANLSARCKLKQFQIIFHTKWKGAVRDVIEQVMRVQGKWNIYYFDGKHDW
jgi:3-deoxy-D-manno-octulosonate 8-phosphate phosphatase (KDO 8-P phosphatase)